MGAKKRKRPMSNEEAVLKLEAAGYTMEQFSKDGLGGYYVPLQLWSKYVGKFNPGMKRGWRVELNTESSREVGRRFNMDEINEMTASLGIGNGNSYTLDYDDKLDVPIQIYRYGSGRQKSISDYHQPIKVGEQFITNIMQAHRQFKAKVVNPQKELYVLTPKNPEGKTLLNECERAGNYRSAMFGNYFKINNNPITLMDFYKRITLGPDGVLNGIKRPYGTIVGVYVHFFPTWKTKREARYHVLFDHGAKVVITNDWITRSWKTTYPEDQVFNQCAIENENDACTTCEHKHFHIENKLCKKRCVISDTEKCETVLNYRTQNMFIVHTGHDFKIPEPANEPGKYVSLEDRVRQMVENEYILVSGLPTKTRRQTYKLIDHVVNYAGGRIDGNCSDVSGIDSFDSSVEDTQNTKRYSHN